MNAIIDRISKQYLKKVLPDVTTGDIVRVAQKIQEGGKTRSQVFEGIVIERSGGVGIASSITVRKVSNGVGVEKKYLLNSPTIEKITVLRSSKVRRKKIFFLRNLSGKATKLKERKRMVALGLEPDAMVAPNEDDMELAQPEVAEEVSEVVETPTSEETNETPEA